MLASEMKDHIIVVGRGHLGSHLVDHPRETAQPYVLIEKDSLAVDDLLRAGEPVIVDDAKQESTLLDAGVERARLIVITSNVIETALLVTKRARERLQRNRHARRCRRRPKLTFHGAHPSPFMSTSIPRHMQILEQVFGSIQRFLCELLLPLPRAA